MHRMEKKTRFLIFGLVIVFVFCIGVFGFMTQFINKQNNQTMDSVGRLFMTATNERISMHFSTMIALRLSHLKTLAETIPFVRERDGEKFHEWLLYNARIHDFESMAFLYEDGSYELLYGEPVELVNPGQFRESLLSGKQNIWVGIDAEGTRHAVIGAPFTAQMGEGKKCIAITAGMPIKYISDILSLNEDNSLVYSFVLRWDGTFVIRSYGAYRNNYFERVEEVYENIEGMDKERYIAEIKEAMKNKQEYSVFLTMHGERRQMFCSPLPNSEWSLLTFMPYGTLNETVKSLAARSFFVSAGCCLIILIWLFVVFMVYYNINKHQVAELKEAKQAAEEANRSKSEFLSNMSHDIRTPMNAVVGMTSIALANIDNKTRVQDCLKKIMLSSKHLLGLINDVLDMSKIESGKIILNVERVSLRELMDSIVSIIRPQVKAKQQQFHVRIYDISSENVLCDSVRLNQVLLNLLSNAIKFTPEGGLIETSMREIKSPKGEGYMRVLIRVKDTGIGMSEEFQAHIFESFAREDSKRVQKTEGTGLGMAITKYIVDAMEGDIQLNSAPGHGTEFIVTLDFERATEREEEMLLPDFTMLVVDDDQQLCESTVSMLKSIGVRAEWTLDGENAIEMVTQRHRRQEDYQLVLLDWKLPGMDGIKIARLLRKELGDAVPILLLSAYDCSEVEQEAREAGINGFMSKPLFKSTLYYGLKPYVSAANEEAHPDAWTTELKGKHILLAEDNELNAEIAMELLQDMGLELDWVENGQLCAEKFANAPVGYYDAVLMDLRMPVKNGYEATEMIRAMDRADASIPIIAMTADAFSEDVQRCIEHGMNAHVAKPIDTKELSRVLSRFFERIGSV